MSPYDWDVYGICKCGARFALPAGDLFHLHFEVCPQCGESKNSFRKVTGRWVSHAKLFHPSTWGKCEFIERGTR